VLQIDYLDPDAEELFVHGHTLHQELLRALGYLD